MSTPGNYVATLSYTRYNAAIVGTSYQIALPFTVVATLGVRAIPNRIAVGDTVLIEASGLNPGETVTSLVVACAGSGSDQAVGVAQIYNGFATSWPGPFFDGACDSSVPGATGSRS